MKPLAPPSSSADRRTDRFLEKRERILEAATRQINRYGVKGMTFVDVAKLVDLNTTSITYYFKRKEQLAAAVLDRTLGRLEEMAATAAEQPTPQLRVRAYIRAHVDHLDALRRHEEGPLAGLSDIRALSEPHRSALIERYNDLFRNVRAFWGKPADKTEMQLQTARTHVLAENIFWLPIWLRDYSLNDYDRVCDRLCELLEKGLAPDNARWEPQLLPFHAEQLPLGDDAMPDNFMRAATRLINQLGYRGASVERIVAELNVTKGSFYHHLETKDELVLECFRRSYGHVSQVQHAAIDAGGTYWQQISSAMASLLQAQLVGDDCLLRTSAIQSLPSQWQSDVLTRSGRLIRRFGGMISDGIAEGSIRPVDSLIASQSLMCMLNAAFELRGWASNQDPQTAVAMYASTLVGGLFSQP